MPVVLVVGVAVMDFVFFVDEMPARPEKYRARDAAITGGGCAANAAFAIAQLGGRANLAGRLGDDAVGDLIQADLRSAAIDMSGLRRHAGHRSSFSSVYVDRAGERQIMNFRDHSLPRAPGWLHELDFTGVAAVLADTRWAEGATEAMRIARDRGVPGILDAEAPFDGSEEAVRLASHVAFSAQGLRAYAGGGDIDDCLRRHVVEPAQFVCVTDGGRGVFWRTNRDSGAVPAFPVSAVETLGAGDLWHGAFALRLAEGVGESDAVRFANAASALKCTRTGGRHGYPTRAEVETFLLER
jgi:sulfofructose kinase